MRVPIPQDWDNESWCRWAICWPDSPVWNALLIGWVSQYARGWTWDERTGNLMYAIGLGREIEAKNIPLKGVIMACDDNDLLAAALNNIAAALLQSNSGQGGKGCCDAPDVLVSNTFQNYVTQPVGGTVVPVYGSEPPLVTPEAGYPDGYESQEAYDLDKCRKAYAIVRGAIQALRNLGAITTFNTIALAGLIGLAIGGAIIFPPAAVPIMVGLLLSLFGATGILSVAADQMETDIDQWACTLYSGDRADSTIGAIADLIDVLIGLISASGTAGVIIKSVILVIFSSNTLNQLFSSVGMEFYPEADCSNCGECETLVEFQFAEGAELWGLTSESCDAARLSTSGASVGWVSDNGGSLRLYVPANSPEAIVVAENSDLETGLVVRAGQEIRILHHVGADNVFSRWYIIFSVSGCVQVGSAGLVANTESTMIFDLSAYVGEEIVAIQGTAENSIGGNVSLDLMDVSIVCSD